MNEFELIEYYFRPLSIAREDVTLGIGDDAAVLSVPANHELVVSTDTLVSGVHFLPHWDAYDIAYKAVMATISDIAAMGAEPSWLLLALTLPDNNPAWLKRFSQGLSEASAPYRISLIGGDTTRGPLAMTLTIHGFVPKGEAISRSGAKAGDRIFVSGALGGAAQAVAWLDSAGIPQPDREAVMEKLLHPKPRFDFLPILRSFATAAIDISDGLGADLHHICQGSKVGATLTRQAIPIHPIVNQYQGVTAVDMALAGGDDYELCFTVAEKCLPEFRQHCLEMGLTCSEIGVIDKTPGLRMKHTSGDVTPLQVAGYQHFG